MDALKQKHNIDKNQVLVEFIGNGVNFYNAILDLPTSKRKADLVTIQSVAEQAIEGILTDVQFKTGNQLIDPSAAAQQLKYSKYYRNLKICFGKCDNPNEQSQKPNKSLIRRFRELGGFKIPVVIPLIAACFWIGTYQTSDSDKVCFRNLDCFSLNQPWSQRPPIFHFVPQSPTAVKTRFKLYSRLNQNGCDLTGKDDLMASSNIAKDLFVIIHGYMDDISTWVSEMKNSLIKNNDVTVLLVDWRFGAKMYYPQVVANTRVVAAEISIFLEKFLKTMKIGPENVHLIGHSLGGMISGYVGKRVQGIGKITGLDPAFPLFENYDPVMRLSSKDAKSVQVIHSNIGPFGFGFRQPLGTVDIYLNDGRDQPGCKKMQDLLKNPLSAEGFTGIQDDVACSHRRAYEIYNDLIKRNGSIVVYPCCSWESALNNSCDIFSPVGFNALEHNLTHGVYKMLATSESSPFI